MDAAVTRRGVQLDVATVIERTLARASPSIANGARGGTLVGPIRSLPGHPGQLRSAYGPGRALVADAGYLKDPAAAHGLSDAFRDAELLATAVLSDDLDAMAIRDRSLPARRTGRCIRPVCLSRLSGKRCRP